MPTRNLGRTGYKVRLFSLGGESALDKPDNHDVAIPLIDRAIDLGVNYLDTAPWYGRPERWSQRYIGEVMKRRRKEVYLATKTHDRTYDGSMRLLEDSLKLLQTDHVDAWQLHRLSTPEDNTQVFGKNGAMKALLEARESGMVRNLGITGHTDPDVLMEAMRRFEFDQILMAFNAADPHHLSFTAKLLPLAVEKRMGIIGMKVCARGRLLDAITMREAMDYVLSYPVSTVIVGCDTLTQLEENVELARTFTPINAAQMAAIHERTKPIASECLWFRRGA
jgi:aryl-alcohol dehydrogenase-like predicted oxidoreductase